MPRQLNPADYGVGSFQELARIIGTLGGETDPRHRGGIGAKAMILDIAKNRSHHPEYQKFNTATDKGMEGGPENYTGVAAQMVRPGQFSTWGEAQKGAFKKAVDLHNDIIELSRNPNAWDKLPTVRQQEINEGLEAMRGVLVTRDLEGAAGGALMYGNPAGMKQAMRARHETKYGLRDSADMYGHRYYTGRPAETRGVREAIERFDLEGRIARMQAGSPPPPYEQPGYFPLDPKLYDPATNADYMGSPQGGPGFGHVAGVFPDRPPEFTGGEYKISPDAPAEGMFNINKSLGGFRPMRARGADVAGIDTTGIAFDQHGNPLGNVGVSRAWQEGLRDLQGAYDNTEGAFADSAEFAGRYAYPGDIRPQDAMFLAENPGGFVTREGRQVLPIEYAADVLGLGSPQDYAGRYDTAELGIDDALFLKDNPQFTLAKGGANTGYGYTQDPSGAYVPNTGGAGSDQRFQQQGGAEPTPVPGDWNYIPRPGDWNYIPPRTGYDPATGGVIGAQPAFPSASSLNGFDTPTQGYTPPPYTPTYQDTLNASTIGYNPSAVVSNPSAAASTIPGINIPFVVEPTVPSFNPGSLATMPSLGGSGISPSSTGPSGGGFANPYGADPNFSNPGGQPRIGIIMPNTLEW